MTDEPIEWASRHCGRVDGGELPAQVMEATTALGRGYPRGVPYERVVQVVSRQTGQSRSSVESAVESLHERGRLAKPSADYLRPIGTTDGQ